MEAVLASMADGEIRKDGAAGAKSAGAWSGAGIVEEADLPVQAPIATTNGILTKGLALC